MQLLRKSETAYVSQRYAHPAVPPAVPDTDFTEQMEVQNTQPMEANTENVQTQNAVQSQVPVSLQDTTPVTVVASDHENKNDVQYGVEINTDFSGSFAHNEVTSSNQNSIAQPEEQNSSFGVNKTMKKDLMNMFNGTN